jgi:hypothetical protein
VNSLVGPGGNWFKRVARAPIIAVKEIGWLEALATRGDH